MLASTTSKWGLNREVQAALLRVRTGPESPEDILRELMGDSSPNCGIARERGKKRRGERENIPTKSSNLRGCLTQITIISTTVGRNPLEEME